MKHDTLKGVFAIGLVTLFLVAGFDSMAFATSAPKPVWLVVRGMDNGIWYGGDVAGTWAGWTKLPGATPDSPAAAICLDTLHIVVRGMTGNDIWYGYVTLASKAFSGWQKIDGATPSAPGLAAAWYGLDPCHLFLAVRGNDNGIYYRTATVLSAGGSPTWTAWSKLTGATIDSPAITATTESGALYEVHVVVLGTTGYLYHSIYSGSSSSWSSWVNLDTPPSKITSLAPELAAVSSIEVCLTARDSGNRIALKVRKGVSWSEWSRIPTGTTPNSPSVVANWNDVLYFAVRESSGNGIYWCSYDTAHGSWSSWTKVSGSTPTQPAIASDVNPIFIIP